MIRRYEGIRDATVVAFDDPKGGKYIADVYKRQIVDTIFVSNLIGVEAMSAVTLSLPVETLVQLTGYCLCLLYTSRCV